jgi:hypothetical protein
MSSRPRYRIHWPRVIGWTAALAWCFFTWYWIVRLGSEMFFQLNNGGV